MWPVFKWLIRRGRKCKHEGSETWEPTHGFILRICCSVAKSDSLRPHGLQHARLPCPLLSPRVCSDSCPLNPLMSSNHLILCCTLLFLPSIFPSIRVFSSESHSMYSLLVISVFTQISLREAGPGGDMYQIYFKELVAQLWGWLGKSKIYSGSS